MAGWIQISKRRGAADSCRSASGLRDKLQRCRLSLKPAVLGVSQMNRARAFYVYFAAMLLFAYYGPALVQMDVFTKDMIPWASWFYTYKDPALFHNDIHMTYWLANTPVGYKAIFRVLSPYVDTQIIAETLAFALGALSAFLAFVLGRQISGGKTWGGVANLTLVLLSQATTFYPFRFLNLEAGGLPRAFGFPILLFGIIAMLRRDLRWVGGALVLSALFYPPLCVILGTYIAFALGFRIIKERTLPKGFLPLAALGAGAAALVVWTSLGVSATNGPLYTLAQMLQMPEYGPEGTQQDYFPGSWWGYLGPVFGGGQGVIGIVWILLIAATFAVGVVKKDHFLIRPEVVAIPASALINYVAAYVLILRLYEPSRYLTYTSEALTLCCLPFFLKYTADWASPWLTKLDALRPSDKVARRAGVILVTLVGLGAFSARVVLKRGDHDRMPSEVYEFLKTIPKDALVAANPTDGDRIPMRSLRSVLLLWASFYPIHPSYYEEMKRRFFKLLAAEYDTGPDALQDLKRAYGVRYFIVHKDLGRNEPFLEFRPFKEYELGLRAKLGEKQPYIRGLAKEATVFQKGDYAVLDLDRAAALR
jgi:hypothetical protein